jgi:intermembrane space import and assembly protein 40
MASDKEDFVFFSLKSKKNEDFGKASGLQNNHRQAPLFKRNLQPDSAEEEETTNTNTNSSDRQKFNSNAGLDTSSDEEVSAEEDADEYRKSGSSPSGAINPETGEVNWDCPCLKSALEPPCGDSFKSAFSCFVASRTEPKGMDCHDFFRAMQECFISHPEKYGSLESDDDFDDDDDLKIDEEDESSSP